MFELSKVDVVILCGGLGKRLRPVINDRPKVMSDINGHPFLDIIIDYITDFESKRLILCTGYKSNFIKRYYRYKKTSLEIIFSEEKELLGTAGAIKNAESFIKSSPFLVLNGDSFCRLDLRRFLQFHLGKEALISIVLTKAIDGIDYGNVVLGESAQIITFGEKTNKCKNSFVNAGIYLLQKEVLSAIPSNKYFSLERDLFPRMIANKFYGYVTSEMFIDIGTPARYKQARDIWKEQI